MNSFVRWREHYWFCSVEMPSHYNECASSLWYHSFVVSEFLWAMNAHPFVLYYRIKSSETHSLMVKTQRAGTKDWVRRAIPVRVQILRETSTVMPQILERLNFYVKVCSGIPASETHSCLFHTYTTSRQARFASSSKKQSNLGILRHLRPKFPNGIANR